MSAERKALSVELKTRAERKVLSIEIAAFLPQSFSLNAQT